MPRKPCCIDSLSVGSVQFDWSILWSITTWFVLGGITQRRWLNRIINDYVVLTFHLLIKQPNHKLIVFDLERSHSLDKHHLVCNIFVNKGQHGGWRRTGAEKKAQLVNAQHIYVNSQACRITLVIKPYLISNETIQRKCWKTVFVNDKYKKGRPTGQ